MYQLIKPKKRTILDGYKSIAVPYILFVAFLIVLGVTLQHALIVLAASLTALAFMFPVIRNDIEFNYTMELLWNNKNYVTLEEFIELVNGLNVNVFLRNNANKQANRLQELVDAHKGKDLRVKKYKMPKELAEDLKKV